MSAIFRARTSQSSCVTPVLRSGALALATARSAQQNYCVPLRRSAVRRRSRGSRGAAGGTVRLPVRLPQPARLEPLPPSPASSAASSKPEVFPGEVQPGGERPFVRLVRGVLVLVLLRRPVLGRQAGQRPDELVRHGRRL